MAFVVCTPNQALTALALLQVKVIWLSGFATVHPAADGAVKVANVGPVGAGAALGDGLGDGLAEGVSLGDGDGVSLGLADGLALGVCNGSLPVPRDNSRVSSTMTAMRITPPMIDNRMMSLRDLPLGSDGGPPVGGWGGSGGWLNRTVGASDDGWLKDSVGWSWLMASLSLVWGAAGRQLSESICRESRPCRVYLRLSVETLNDRFNGVAQVGL